MSKEDEREILRFVYGILDDRQLIDFESPDFLVRKDGVAVLGVEVTEYFDNDTETRLRKIPGYARELIESRKFRHKDDKLNIRVEQVIYLPGGDQAKAKPIIAIIHEPLHLARRLDLLSDLVNAKSTKIPAYLGNVPEVDIVINDPSFAFRFEDYNSFYHSIGTSGLRQTILQTAFREIFLITRAGRRSNNLHSA